MNNGTSRNERDGMEDALYVSARRLGRLLGTICSRESCLGMALLCEALTPMLLDAEHHGLDIRTVRVLLVNVLMGVDDAKEAS